MRLAEPRASNREHEEMVVQSRLKGLIDAGEVTLTSLHFTFTGTMYNETDLTKAIPYRGGGFWTYDAQYVWDLATYRFLAMVDGRPTPLLVGLEKFTYDPFEVVSHINERFVPVVCDALS